MLLSTLTFLPESQLQAIETDAFSESGLESIHIPRLVELLDEGCFCACGQLSSLTFAPGCQVRRLGRRAFESCLSLPSVHIPSGVESIGERCFRACAQLTTVTFEAHSKLSTIEAAAFQHCHQQLGPSIQLPSAFTAIPENCFRHCDSLSAINLEPNSSLREIGHSAFADSSLISFRIPGSVAVINWTCFQSANTAVDATFELPSRVRAVVEFDPGRVTELAMPDSAEVMTITRGGKRGFICHFGPDSRLQDLLVVSAKLRGFAFMRLSQASLKRIRSASEWIAS